MTKLVVNQGRFSPEVRQLRKELRESNDLTDEEKKVGRTITDGMGISPACRLSAKQVGSRTEFSVSSIIHLMTKGLKRYFAFIQPPKNDIWRRMLISEGYQGKYIFFIRPGWLTKFNDCQTKSRPSLKSNALKSNSLLVGALKSDSRFYIIYNLVYNILDTRYKREKYKREKTKEENERRRRFVISDSDSDRRSRDHHPKTCQNISSHNNGSGVQQLHKPTDCNADRVGVGFAVPTANLPDFTGKKELDRASLEILSSIVNDPIMRQTFTTLYPDNNTGKLIVGKELKPLEEWKCRDFVMYICIQLKEKCRVRVSPISWRGDCAKIAGFLGRTRLTAKGYKEMIDWLVENICTDDFIPEIGYFASYTAYTRWKSKIPAFEFKSRLSPMMQSEHEFVRSSQEELERMAAEQDRKWGMADMTGDEIEAEARRLLAKLGE